MIYIKEEIIPNQSITIWVDGILNTESVAILKRVCDRYLPVDNKISLQLDGLTHISREGRAFLKEVEGQGISLIGLKEINEFKDL